MKWAKQHTISDYLLQYCEEQICMRTYLSVLLDHGNIRLECPDAEPLFLTGRWGMEAKMFTKTRQDELIRTHCRSDSEASTVNTVKCADRGRLNTLNTWNCAAANPLSFRLTLWTANKRARTTDSENTVVTRTFDGSGREHGLEVSQATWIIRIWAKYSKCNAHRICPVGKRQRIISATWTGTFSSTNSQCTHTTQNSQRQNVDCERETELLLINRMPPITIEQRQPNWHTTNSNNCLLAVSGSSLQQSSHATSSARHSYRARTPARQRAAACSRPAGLPVHPGNDQLRHSAVGAREKHAFKRKYGASLFHDRWSVIRWSDHRHSV